MKIVKVYSKINFTDVWLDRDNMSSQQIKWGEDFVDIFWDNKDYFIKMREIDKTYDAHLIKDGDNFEVFFLNKLNATLLRNEQNEWLSIKVNKNNLQEGASKVVEVMKAIISGVCSAPLRKGYENEYHHFLNTRKFK